MGLHDLDPMGKPVNGCEHISWVGAHLRRGSEVYNDLRLDLWFGESSDTTSGL
jgi:hypothetical protein